STPIRVRHRFKERLERLEVALSRRFERFIDNSVAGNVNRIRPLHGITIRFTVGHRALPSRNPVTSFRSLSEDTRNSSGGFGECAKQECEVSLRVLANLQQAL